MRKKENDTMGAIVYIVLLAIFAFIISIPAFLIDWLFG